jgi:biopolymer transport protein ExbB
MIAQVTLFELLQQGGWAMYPLGTLSLALFMLILFSWMQTSRGLFGFTKSRWTDQPVTRQFQARIKELQALNPTELRDRLGDQVQMVEGSALRWIQYMNVIATIAPMVGLLGTVSGMIGAFQTIATGGMGKPELLAGDIGEALITTATGLTIGIPAMIFYFLLRNRLDARLEELEEWIEKSLPSGARRSN